MSAIEFEKFCELYTGYADDCLKASTDFYNAAVFKNTIKKLWITAEKLIENGKKYNLTSILDPEEVIRKHIIDSLLPFSLIYEDYLKSHAGRIIDVGTGAGFPLLPLAAVLSELDPEAVMTGVDSTGKKIRHIEEVVSSAGLKNVTAINGRAEELGRGTLRETQQVATARAVSSLPVILELCVPFVRTGGIFVALKSHLDGETEQARKTAEKMGAREIRTAEYQLPGGDKRTIVVYRKEEKTPARYPRRYSEIVRGKQ